MAHTSTLFQRLKPVCVNVTRNCSVQHLNEAITVLKSLKKCDINEIAMLEYVLFPFRITLQKRNLMREDQEILCFRCLQTVFTKCHSSVIRDEIVSWCLNTFSLYFASLNINERNMQKEKVIQEDISEERKLELVKLVLSMFVNINCLTMMTLYQDKYMPVVGHVLSILLNIIETERNRELQISALNCLKTLSGFTFKNDRHCSELAGKCWASYLPGICMSFNRLFTLNSNIGQNILATSLETFVYIIYIVLNDDLNMELLLSAEITLEDIFASKLSGTDRCDDKILESTSLKSLGVTRNKEWLQKTATHMNLLLKSILPLFMCHRKVKVKMAVLGFVETLLQSCMKTLSLSALDLLDVLLKHSCDEIDEVKHESQRVLNLAMQTFQSVKVRNVKDMLNEKLYSELISLPRVMNSSSDDVKLAKLQVIKGYMYFYGENMREMLNTYALLERFLISLMHILELENNNINLVEERTSIFRQALDIGTEIYDNRFYRKNFKLFRNITIHKLIKDIIFLLAKYANVELLVDYLLEQCHNSSLLRKQAFCILNEVLLGLLQNNSKDTKIEINSNTNINSIVELMMSTYLDDELMNLPVTNTYINQDDVIESDELFLTVPDKIHQDAYVIPFEVLSSNIQLICILLEGLSNCAHLLETNFNDYLIQTLYVVLEKVGSVNAAVSHCAMETLNDIVRFCNYKDTSDLILLNSDYLLNSITLQFRRLVRGSAAPAVLCVVLRFCSAELIPIISDVISDVFEILDEYQEEVASDVLMVLKYYNIAIDRCHGNFEAEQNRQKPQSTIVNKTEKEVTDVSNDSASIVLFVEEYCKLKMHAQGIVEEDEYTNVDVDEDVVEDGGVQEDTDKKVTPPHYKVVITALEKCVAFTAASQAPIRLKALEVVLHGVYALRDRENDLLPLIHKLWPPIIRRLKDQEHTLALKTLDVVCRMVEYSGNFITKRMTTDFLPYTVKFLQDNYKEVSKEKSTFTHLYKTQKKLIYFLGEIVPPLEVSTDLFSSISSAIVLYTNCHLLVDIQETAVSALMKFYSHRPNIIWLLCHSLYTSSDWTCPDGVFKPLSFVKEGEGNEYQENMLKIQKVIGSEYQTFVT